jgi:hypothetical protein
LWLTSLLLQLPVKEQLWEQHTKTKLGLTDDGLNVLNWLALPTTPSSTGSTDANEASSSVPLQQLLENIIFKQRFQKPGCRNSQKNHFKYMLDLPGAWTAQPIQRRRPSIFLHCTKRILILRQ